MGGARPIGLKGEGILGLISVIWDVGGGSEDSIEHYSRCPIALDSLKTKLKIHIHPNRGLSTFALDAPELKQDNVLALVSLHIYAVYMATNFYRHNPHLVGISRAKECIWQHTIQGSLGSKLESAIRNRWQEPEICIS